MLCLLDNMTSNFDGEWDICMQMFGEYHCVDIKIFDTRFALESIPPLILLQSIALFWVYKNKSRNVKTNANKEWKKKNKQMTIIYVSKLILKNLMLRNIIIQAKDI
jgi:hypothetical protein